MKTYEQYLLDRLAEEGVEVAQRVLKASAFGLTEIQPGQAFDNRERLSMEVDDFLGVLSMLQESGFLRPSDKLLMQIKKEKVAKFYQYAIECGTVELPWKHKIEINEQELGTCTICGGSEGSMPTDCPYEEMAYSVERLVLDGYLDFKAGRWVDGRNPAKWYIWPSGERQLRIPNAIAMDFIQRGAVQSFTRDENYPGAVYIEPIQPPEGM